MENRTFDFTVSGGLDLSWSGTDCTKPSLQTPYFGPDMNGLWFTNRENISENSSRYNPSTIFMGSEKAGQCELEYCPIASMVRSISHKVNCFVLAIWWGPIWTRVKMALVLSTATLTICMALSRKAKDRGGRRRWRISGLLNLLRLGPSLLRHSFCFETLTQVDTVFTKPYCPAENSNTEQGNSQETATWLAPF